MWVDVCDDDDGVCFFCVGEGCVEVFVVYEDGVVVVLV